MNNEKHCEFIPGIDMYVLKCVRVVLSQMQILFIFARLAKYAHEVLNVYCILIHCSLFVACALA